LPTILHIVPAAEFYAQPADAPYRTASLETEGFIHCTQEPEILLSVANTIYRNIPGDFLTLVLDSERITAPVKFEPPIPPPPPDHPLAQHLFPHIYGPLNRDAIVEIRSATRAEDGAFLAV